MNYSHMWGEGWHGFSIIFFVAMIFFLIIVFSRKRPFWRREGFGSRWMRDCFGYRDINRPSESAIEILKKRYAGGEISKEEFEKMKKDIEPTGGSNDS